MSDSLSNRINLKVDNKLYDSLMKEAGDERLIPGVIRKRLEESYLGQSDIAAIKKQQMAILRFLAEVVTDTAYISGRLRRNLSKQDERSRLEEEESLKQIVAERLGSLHLFLQNEGLG